MNNGIPYDCIVAAEWLRRMRDLCTAFEHGFDEESYFENGQKLKEMLEPVVRDARKTSQELERYIRSRHRQVAEDKFFIAALQKAPEAIHTARI